MVQYFHTLISRTEWPDIPSELCPPFMHMCMSTPHVQGWSRTYSNAPDWNDYIFNGLHCGGLLERRSSRYSVGSLLYKFHHSLKF